MKKILSALALTAFLTGCGGGPSDAEIEGLIKAEIAKANELMASLGPLGKKGITEIVNISNHGCDSHKTMDGAYACDLEITSKNMLLGDNTERKIIDLAKTNGGKWYFVR
ncbi:hypothetical protein [Sedimenticola hydrogenitrophicus]|uniref:hypothetical protein n=1 Tax=Sedimenticola hydrogenitrophicus TaxID=2967975 RepID=UPI0023B1832B|nr:hypothetical protein [Sedimenticola hydrogenitrophicus]